jgi:hypothetical protein
MRPIKTNFDTHPLEEDELQVATVTVEIEEKSAEDKVTPRDA